MPDAPVTRTDLRRALVLNALAKPLNVVVPALVLIAWALADLAWLGLVALVAWLGLVGTTFFDEREAQRVGRDLRAQRGRAGAQLDTGELTPLIAGRVKAAKQARAAIHEAIAGAGIPLDDVGREVDALVSAIAADAARAQRMHLFLLGEEEPDALERRIAAAPRAEVRVALEAKRAALETLRRRFEALMSEIDRAVATLETVQAQILATGDRALEERRLAGQVSELRARVEVVSAGLDEAFAETRVR